MTTSEWECGFYAFFPLLVQRWQQPSAGFHASLSSLQCRYSWSGAYWLWQRFHIFQSALALVKKNPSCRRKTTCLCQLWRKVKRGREALEVTQWSEGASTLKALWQQIWSISLFFFFSFFFLRLKKEHEVSLLMSCSHSSRTLRWFSSEQCKGPVCTNTTR